MRDYTIVKFYLDLVIFVCNMTLSLAAVLNQNSGKQNGI